MGPYAFTQAFLSGFFGFAAMAAFVIWARARRDRSLLILALGSAIWAVQSAAVLSVASSTRIEDAQRALDLRTMFGALGVAATLWLFLEVTGVRARAFVWFATLVMVGAAAATAAGIHLVGTVTWLEQVSLPWGETFSAYTRTDPHPTAAPIYAVIVVVVLFTLVIACRFMARDRIGGVLLILASMGLGVAVGSSLLIDLLRVRLPYPGMFGVAAAIVVIALQFARANRVRDEQLATADRRFRAIFDQTFQFIGLLDVDGTLLEANDTALRFAGVRADAVLGKKFWDTPWWAHSHDLQNRLRDAIRRAAHGEAVRFEVSHVAQDGKLRSVDFSLKPVRDSQGVVVLLIPEGHDITERKEAGEALRTSEERFRFLIQNQTEFVVSCRPDTTLTFVNDSYCRYFGSAVDTIVGTRLFDRIVPHDREALARQLAELTRDASISTVECQVTAGDGEQRWTHWTISGVFAAGGDLATLQMTGRDIHDRVVAEQGKRTLEQQLLQSQKMEALGQLAGGIAHDFNNLLTVIAGHTDMLLGGTDQQARHDLDQIRLACERAASMTRQLLAFSRQSVLEPRIVDMNAIVAQTETMLRRTIGEHIELVVRADGDLLPVRADPDQVSRVLLNMAINARDAMPKGGRLLIETRNVTVPNRASSPGALGDYVLLAMSDTGCGIPAESKARLFEPFYTTKPQGQGTGLGLAVVDGIVKQSGGWIDVESELDVGTTFQIFLPATDRGAAGEAARSREPAPTHGSEILLLVEDEPAVRLMTQTALQGYGYTVLCAASGHDALRTVTARQGRIDLVLTDVVMPGMSGPQLAERVRRDYPAIAVVFMSGYTSDAVFRQGIEAGEADFVQKPFNTAALAVKLRQVLDRR
jgi:two-component system, cell cycle sensor histidine kinase and response regulator CckA